MQGTARGHCFRFPHESPKRAFAISHGKRFVQREARPRAEADAGHRKRALLPLPEQRTHELAVLAQRSARREARSRAEADAGHRKRALLPLPARETKRAFAISHGKRFVQREAHLPVIGNAARLHANELRPFRILLPYHKQQTARRRPAPGCLLFFSIYKTELNQYNKVRSIKHRRKSS